jgi:hypothetical protein
MNSSWKTTLFGVLAALPSFLHGMGVSVGHVGSGDWLTFTQGIMVAVLGLVAKDGDKSNAPNPLAASQVVK